jgi:hypothetical protein
MFHQINLVTNSTNQFNAFTICKKLLCFPKIHIHYPTPTFKVPKLFHKKKIRFIFKFVVCFIFKFLLRKKSDCKHNEPIFKFRKDEEESYLLGWSQLHFLVCSRNLQPKIFTKTRFHLFSYSYTHYLSFLFLFFHCILIYFFYICFCRWNILIYISNLVSFNEIYYSIKKNQIFWAIFSVICVSLLEETKHKYVLLWRFCEWHFLVYCYWVCNYSHVWNILTFS